jgi:hypothetical protein
VVSLVECRSGHTYAEEPVAVHWEDKRLEVVEIEKSWHSPEGKHFLVRTANALEFELRYDESKDIWHITPC